jgi:hypothetical protein
VKLAEAYGLPRVNLAAKAVLTMVMAMTTRGILIRRKEHRRYESLKNIFTMHCVRGVVSLHGMHETNNEFLQHLEG